MWKPYLIWIVFTEAVGGLSGWLTRDGTKAYMATVEQPPLSPPSIVFPIVWAVLFALMGFGAARIYSAQASRARTHGLLLFLKSFFQEASDDASDNNHGCIVNGSDHGRHLLKVF